MDDTIYRQAAIATAERESQFDGAYGYMDTKSIVDMLNDLPSAQPGITLESAIDYLHSIGWMQEHDRTLTESAQPERKKGKWIIRDNPGTGWYRVTCSECGEDVTSTAPAIGFLPNAKVLWDYCPYCGSFNGGTE